MSADSMSRRAARASLFRTLPWPGARAVMVPYLFMICLPVIRLGIAAVAVFALAACSNQSDGPVRPVGDDGPPGAGQHAAEPAAEPALVTGAARPPQGPAAELDASSTQGTQGTQGAAPEAFHPELVVVPGGTLSMGSGDSEAGRYPNEGPRHRVEIAAFALCRTEVSQAQWQAVMGTSPSECRFGCGPDLPVQQVSWFDAIEYLNRLSEREDETACYAGTGDAVKWDKGCTGYRLPTEAEWEYAARAGTGTAYSFGTDASALADHAWYVNNSRDKVHAVAGKKPNPWGLYDLYGNVYEWVWDWSGAYVSESRAANPSGPDRGRLRILRGGSFVSRERDLRSANRFGVVPASTARGLGLRCARNKS